MVIVHHEGRKAEVPLGGSRQILDPRVARRVCEELGLDWSELPGPKTRVLSVRRDCAHSAQAGNFCRALAVKPV